MARILVRNEVCTATMTEPDADGLIGWEAECGSSAETAMHVADAIEDATVHVEFQCPRWGYEPR